MMPRGLAPSFVFAAQLSLPMIAVAQATVPVSTPASADDANAAAASAQAETGRPPQRIRSITLTGDQKCPKSADPNEIVVCAKQDEPYRIPKPLRDDKPIPAQNQSWVNRASTIDDIGRRAGGLPDTCSPVGSGGQTGCAQKIAQEYDADKRARAAERRTTP